MVERTEFGHALRQQLDRQRVSVRELARRLNPADPETARRNIARWLAPRESAVSPSRASVRSVAAALGVDEHDLLPAGDDEEDEHPLVAFLLDALEARQARRQRQAVGA